MVDRLSSLRPAVRLATISAQIASTWPPRAKAMTAAPATELGRGWLTELDPSPDRHGLRTGHRWPGAGDRAARRGAGADTLAALVPAAGWQELSCGYGAKGPRFYDWAQIATASAAHHVLVRRAVGGGELAFFTCHAPPGTTLAELVRVAGARWAIEECFQAAKNETGLDHYQVRRYDAWYRHVSLSMLALAFLAVTAAQRGHHQLWTTFPERSAA